MTSGDRTVRVMVTFALAIGLAPLVVAQPSQPAATEATLGAIEQARAALQAGRLDEAEQLATSAGSSPAASHVLARAAEARGQLDRALGLYQELASREPRSNAALEYGLLLQRKGRATEAAAVLQPMVDRAAGARSPDDLVRSARAARALAQFRLANNLFREAAAAAPDSPAVNTAWGDLLLEKHNLAEAVRSYQMALKANADYAPAHLGIARALIDDNPPASRAAAAKALALNPTLVDAMVIEASIVFDGGDRPEARKIVEAALARNPSWLEAHAMLASLHWIEGRMPEYEQALDRALAINPAWGEGYRIVAEHAAGRYRFEDAAALAKKATALDPGNARAWADLGKHLLRVGDEPEARTALDKAFELDPFYEITFNLLSMLDTLKEFEVIEAGPLVIKLHPDESPVMKDTVVALATESLAALSKRYDFTPKGPILIEMFPKHDDFAVRNVGLPGMVGALGACFGRVVTLDSPKARPPGSFNWAATLWHELAHVITLQMSSQRVPRWLTEGVSVFEERRARRYWGRESEMQMVQAMAEGALFPLATLNSGFSDPRRITLAYQQASMVAEHLVERFGDGVLPSLMRAYGEGLEDEAALRKATGVGVKELQQSFDAFMEKRYGAQQRAMKEVPGLEEVIAKQDVAALEGFAASHPDSFSVQMVLGQAQLSAKDFAKARAAFERAATLVPAATGDNGPRAMLARVAEAAGDQAARRRALAQAIEEHVTALELSRELIGITGEAGDKALRQLAAARIVEVDPFDASAYAVVGQLAMADGQATQALGAFRRALAAGPEDPVKAHTDLAEALLATGARADAKVEAVRALEMAPRYERAQDVLLAVVDGAARPR